MASSETDIHRYIHNNRLSIIAKPSAPRTEILGRDESRKALRVAIAAPPDKDKANVELIRFLSKLLGKRVGIVSGRTSKKKVVEIVE
ncbi:YggU family protein [Candidatus Woesearchaeota archaeon]|nr:YggU family protein [Candidatus Woesearchaeota archaeon]